MFSSITVIGNLGAEPEIRHLPSGTIAASVSVAVNKKWTDKEGQPQTDTTWFRLVCYQTGETGLVTGLFQKWLHKGQLVFVTGEPVIRKYVDQQGIQRTAFEIKLGPQSVIKMLGGRPDGAARGDEAPFEHPPTNGVAAPATPGDIDLGEIPI